MNFWAVRLAVKIIYRSKSVQKQFDPVYQSKWRYPPQVKLNLLAMENFICHAVTLQDVISYSPFHFHPLKGDRKGEWSLYVGKTGYRVTVIPCDDMGGEVLDGDIIAQCKSIKIVKVMEVSNHYE